MKDGKPDLCSSGIPARLRVARERARFSQSELSMQAGLDRKTCSIIESGRVQSTVATVERLARALGVTPGWLAFGEGPTAALPASPTPVASPALRPPVLPASFTAPTFCSSSVCAPLGPPAPPAPSPSSAPPPPVPPAPQPPTLQPAPTTNNNRRRELPPLDLDAWENEAQTLMARLNERLPGARTISYSLIRNCSHRRHDPLVYDELPPLPARYDPVLLALANEPIDLCHAEREWLLDVLLDFGSEHMPETLGRLRARLLRIVPEPDHDLVAEVMGQLQDPDPVRRGTLVLQLIIDAGIPIAPIHLVDLWRHDRIAGLAPALEVAIVLLSPRPDAADEFDPARWLTTAIEGGAERRTGPLGVRTKLKGLRDPLLRLFSHRRPTKYEYKDLPPLPQRFDPLLYALGPSLDRSVRLRVRQLLFNLLAGLSVPAALQQLDETLREAVPEGDHALVSEVMADLRSTDRVRAGTLALQLVIDAGLPVASVEMEELMYQNQPEGLSAPFEAAMEIILARIPDDDHRLGLFMRYQMAGEDDLAAM